MRPQVRGVLLERRDEEDALVRAIDDAARGSGRAISIEGPAGIGKTALLGRAASQAADAGFLVLSALGSELEMAYAFGVVQQLVAGIPGEAREQALEETSDAAAAAVGAGPPGRPELPDAAAAIHGLFWMIADLAGRGPVAVCVDDAQWADRPSQRWLGYLARRVEGLSVFMVSCVRTGEPGAPAADPDDPVVVLRPRELTSGAAAELIERSVAQPVEPAFADAARQVTGGNPLLLEQLATSLSADGWRPTEAQAPQLAGFGPPATESFATRRLQGLGEEPAAVARAVAVLGPPRTVELCAALTGLPPGRCSRAADTLVQAGLFSADEPLTFVHPVIEAAIRNSISPHIRSHLHRRAAALLLERGAAPSRAAPYLLETDPGDDPEVVDVLRAAAAEALARGSPDIAARALERARREPPTASAAAGVALELGRVELALGDPGGIDRLREAMALSDSARARAEVALELGPALLMVSMTKESAHVLETAVEELGEDASELRLRLEIALLSSAHMHIEHHERWSRRLARRIGQDEGAPPTLRRSALAHMAQAAAFAGRPPAEVRKLAQDALAGGLMLAELGSESPDYYFAASSLVLGEDFLAARDACSAAREQAEQRGSPVGFAFASLFRALPNLKLGDLDAAEADSLDALGVIDDHSLGLALPGAVIWLLENHVLRGRLEEAQVLLDRFGFDGDLPPVTWFVHLLVRRGALRAEQGRYDEAVADFEETGRRIAALGVQSTAEVFWRSDMAHALVAAGRSDEARAPAEEEVRLARAFGGSYATGRSLLALAAVTPHGEDSAAVLVEARDHARRAGAGILETQTTIAQGTLLRRLGRRADARDALREGLDMAMRCGAHALAGRAREELGVSGARMWREAISGPDSLTPSERRIARMAAAGEANRAIARALFVTEKTVESHLTAAYAKLGIKSRRELGHALADG